MKESLSLSVYCMISRKDYYLETINSIINAKKNDQIKIYFSIKENMYQEIKDKIKEDENNINVIRYEFKYKCVFDHMKVLANHCRDDYIMIVHDDDIVGEEFFINTYKDLFNRFGRVDAILFHQGESDNYPDRVDFYYDNFIEFIRSIEDKGIEVPIYL